MNNLTKNLPSLLQNYELSEQELKSYFSQVSSNLQILIHTPESHSLAQKVAINILLNHAKSQKLNKPIIYTTGFEIGDELYNDRDISDKLRISNLFLIDNLESCIPTNQKYLGNVLNQLYLNSIFGVILTSIKKTQWKGTFDSFIHITLMKGSIQII
jgi:hypothetical protein